MHPCILYHAVISFPLLSTPIPPPPPPPTHTQHSTTQHTHTHTNTHSRDSIKVAQQKLESQWRGVQSDWSWQERVPKSAGPVPETPQLLGGVTPGGLKGQCVVHWVLSVWQDPVQLFHSNTSVDKASCCCLCFHSLCYCPSYLVQSLHVCLLGGTKVAHLIVEHDTLDDDVEVNQDLLVNLELFQLSEKVHVLICFLATYFNQVSVR